MRDYRATIQKVVEYSVLYLLNVSDDEKSRKRRNQKVRDRMKKEKKREREREKKEKEWSMQRARNSQDILRFRVGWYFRESHGATYNDPRGSSNRGLFEIPVFTLIPNVAETRGE